MKTLTLSSRLNTYHVSRTLNFYRVSSVLKQNIGYNIFTSSNLNYKLIRLFDEASELVIQSSNIHYLGATSSIKPIGVECQCIVKYHLMSFWCTIFWFWFWTIFRGLIWVWPHFLTSHLGLSTCPIVFMIIFWFSIPHMLCW